MDFQDVVRRRRMVRTYTDAPVERAAVDRMLANAVRAPSAGFSQGWGFLVLDTPVDVARFWDVTAPAGPASRWLRSMRVAPVVVVPHADPAAYRARYAQPDKRRDAADAGGGATGPGGGAADDAGGMPWAVPYWYVDAGMAALLVLQTAVDEGLGACFFGIPAERTAAYREAFGVPEHLEPVGAITVGHPAPVEDLPGSAARRPRRGVEDVVHRGRWSARG
ncbi:nitroreductase family protein [Cellulomonas sp. NS3]|uniref:nitroreductase family protein n=1 Tax=Cellulomonas sp. NS3 TaxID=2973977 RepID=UPI002161586A|nr:nitroreductase family protein [Cellulomonas sp. NS3]